MGSQQTREVIPPPSKQVVRRTIEQMFIKNKTSPSARTSIVPLKNLNLSDTLLKGGEYSKHNSEKNKYIHPTQNYLKYDPAKLIKDIQNGGKINSPSPDSFQKMSPLAPMAPMVPMSSLSPFKEIKDHLLKTDFQNYQPKQTGAGTMNLLGSLDIKAKPFVSTGGGDIFLNGLSKSPSTELPLKNKFANLFMNGGIKEDSDDSEEFSEDLETKYPVEGLNTRYDSPINSIMEIHKSPEEYDVESTENDENYSYSETSNNTHGILPFYSSDSSDHQFRHPYHKTRY